MFYEEEGRSLGSLCNDVDIDESQSLLDQFGEPVVYVICL